MFFPYCGFLKYSTEENIINIQFKERDSLPFFKLDINIIFLVTIGAE